MSARNEGEIVDLRCLDDVIHFRAAEQIVGETEGIIDFEELLLGRTAEVRIDDEDVVPALGAGEGQVVQRCGDRTPPLTET